MRRLVIALFLSVLIAAPAFAQPAPWQPERLTAGWVVTPSFVVGTLWDSNVTVRNRGNILLEEWVTLVNPRGEIDFNGRRTRFNAGYSGALEAHRTFSELNRYEQRGRVSLRQQMSPRLQLDSRASYFVTPTTDRLELGTLPFLDIGSTVADAGAGFKLALSPRTQLSADYRIQHVTFDREDLSGALGFLNGGYAHSPMVRVTRELARRVSVGGEYQYRHAVLDGGVNTFDIQNALGEVSLRLNASTTLHGAAGSSHLSVSNTGLSVSGPSIRGSVEHRVQRLSLTAKYDRSFVPSFSFGGLTSNEEMTVAVDGPLAASGRLTFGASTTYSRMEPVQALGLGFQLDTIRVSGSLGYQLARWLRTEGFVTIMQQTSDVRGNFDRTRVGIQFVTSKPLRIE